MKIDGKTRITGIFGYPVEHTLSPLIHNAGYEYLKLNFIYVPFCVHPANLARATSSLQTLNIAGINVTVPHKEKIMKYLDEVDPGAKKIGAVNTVVNRNGKLIGYNTDAHGFLKSLKLYINPCGKKVVLLGCGGAGKSIVTALVSANPQKISVYDVDIKRTEKISEMSGKIQIIKNHSSLKDVVSSADILVNATTVGMKRGDNTPINPDWLNKKTFVYDIIYNRKTELLKKAEKIGCKSVGGLDMLLYQAAASFELWTNKKAPVSVMQKALVNVLK